MSVPDIEERPAKKRRFFLDEETPEHKLPADFPQRNSNGDNPGDQNASSHLPNLSGESDAQGPAGNAESLDFNAELLETVIGQKLDKETVARLRDLSSGDIQRAINIYLDGSWQSPSAVERRPSASASAHQDQRSQSSGSLKAIPQRSNTRSPAERAGAGEQRQLKRCMPEKRYIGSFGAVCWATRSGSTLIKHGESVSVGRVKQETVPTKGGKARPGARRRQDNIVRFTNSRGEEVGRLETETSAWLAPLLDQRLCGFDGTCVFAPDHVRTNDTIYLQLQAYFLRTAFEATNFITPVETNRTTGIFEAKETQEERNLHLRQLGLVKLFTEINMNPSKSNTTTEKHKRQGILKAAEVAEQYEEKKEASADNGGSSPPSEDAEEGEELEQDQLDTLYKKAQSFDFNTPEHEPTNTFAMSLRKYQKQALHWMIGKETSAKDEHKEMSMHPLWEEYIWPVKDADDHELPQVEGQSAFYVNPYSGELSLDFPVQEQNCLGGILADEMGLGKTIEMLSLIHTQTSETAKKIAMNDESSTLINLPKLPLNPSTSISAPCTTLVVAPMSLLAQWQSEAEKASKAGSLRVLMYYGNDRSANLQNLCCEANAAYAPNVIITSYGTVLSEFGQVASSSSGSRYSHGGLFSVNFFRIILDEAHNIKNRLSKTAKACYELHAKHRWVLTGTPIVNRLEDLFSLVHFLRVEPWSNFSFWKTFITVPFESKEYMKALDVVQTVLEPLVLRRTKDMKTPDGEPLVPLPPKTVEIERLELSKEEREVYDLIYARARRTFAANVEAGTLMKSYTTIFAQILRLRQSCCHPVLTRNKDILNDEEEAAAAADIASGLADDMDLAALIERFQVEESEQDANKFGAHALQQIQDEAESECPICSEEPMIEQAVTAGCWHSACQKCLIDYIDHQKDKMELPRCVTCREPITLRDLFVVVRHDEDTEPSSQYTDTSSPPVNEKEGESEVSSSLSEPSKPRTRITLRRLNQPSSTKITALVSHLRGVRQTEPRTKSVVFSQFTSFLDLIEPALEYARIPFLRFDGTMAQKQRAEVLARFAEGEDVEDSASASAIAGESVSTKRASGLRPRRGGGGSSSSTTTPTVLLLSLRAGGVGLNLTCAQRVYMMDPWWSWAVEAQAIDRVHRMGQTQPVKVVRFVCQQSIEEKMLKVQDRKKFIASSLGMMSEDEKRAQRLEDIRELLS